MRLILYTQTILRSGPFTVVHCASSHARPSSASPHSRPTPQESLYNLGRAAQQSGALHVAVAYYKRALECPPVADDRTDDLSREAAHNLALIYRASGSHALARQVAETYLAI